MSTSFPLHIELDPASGQIQRIEDPSLGTTLMRFQPGHEIELNGIPLKLERPRIQSAASEHILDAEAEHVPAYMAGSRLAVRRLMTLGGCGLHSGRSRSLHLRWRLRRLPWGEQPSSLDRIWGAPLEAPLFVETLGVLCAPSMFGAGTRMRAVAIGGSGPREHVSLEDGCVAEVVPWLKSRFRNAFPGQQTINGALYYEPEDERWVWFVLRRPNTGGHIEFDTHRRACRFARFQQLGLHDEIVTPEISLFWGRGLQDADRVLAEQFDRFEEPPAWWHKTVWFWLHPPWQPNGSFEHTARGVEILMDECGASGFGLLAHDIPPAGRDIDPRSLRVSPTLGGEDGLRRLTDLIRSKGGHSFVWSSRTALATGGDLRRSWAARGIDGRPCRLESTPEGCVTVEILNNQDPGYEQYLLECIRHYVDLGVDGIFWDSGAQPVGPDFTPRAEPFSPGEAMVAPLDFYEKAYRFGRKLHPDFFQWVEGISADIRSNAYAVDNRTHGPHSGHALMHRLAHAGPRRLIWRSAWPHDLAGGFPFLDPPSDIQASPTPEFYRTISDNPMNRLLCRLVREHGCREAIGLADGISLLGRFVVACPGCSGRIRIPEARCAGKLLRHVLTGATVEGRHEGADGHMDFDLAAGGGYEFA